MESGTVESCISVQIWTLPGNGTWQPLLDLYPPHPASVWKMVWVEKMDPLQWDASCAESERLLCCEGTLIDAAIPDLTTEEDPPCSTLSSAH